MTMRDLQIERPDLADTSPSPLAPDSLMAFSPTRNDQYRLIAFQSSAITGFESRASLKGLA